MVHRSFKCAKCNITEIKEFKSINEPSIADCPQCKKPMVRWIETPPNFTIKGLNAKNSYGLRNN